MKVIDIDNDKQDTLFFWSNGEVVATSYGRNNIRPNRGKYCVDATESIPLYRYGIFSEGGWTSVEYNSLPPEFRMALILLGIE